MTWVIYFLAKIPYLYESFTDRKGEKKKDKISDFWLAFIGSILAATVLWMLNYNPITFLMMVLAWRVLCFDYLTHWLLKRNSESHKHINWFTYSGKTAFTDILISKVNPWLRLLIRVALFAGASWFYFR